ncbi:MAG TPA: SiaB family protein kinase [Flavobacteriales bacterium]|nr:SiaB family protein kinase [Flavobacteriales bacterium]HRE96603.1 SiaB family protein kinase [Flavobacteriales bacterium]HRJ35510.1 SiaB family protein kinase [Flavobacteriales bacterium]HRJ38823.1 SiaB family protein kinase [Flavobacteriales bacterium]
MDNAKNRMLDIFDIYEKMERNNIMLSFKGTVTSELLTSILQIMESRLDTTDDSPKIKKKVFNVLVECLQNLYHHIDEVDELDGPFSSKSAIFMMAKNGDDYIIMTGNFILNQNVNGLRDKLDAINAMDREQLKEYYKSVLNNGTMSAKGGGGLGMIDIARKSGQKLEYAFQPVDSDNSFFSLNVKVTPNV